MAFITSVLKIELDPTTMFEWEKYSQESTEVPHYNDLLEVLNMQAQASESLIVEPGRNIRSEM